MHAVRSSACTVKPRRSWRGARRLFFGTQALLRSTSQRHWPSPNRSAAAACGCSARRRNSGTGRGWSRCHSLCRRTWAKQGFRPRSRCRPRRRKRPGRGEGHRVVHVGGRGDSRDGDAVARDRDVILGAPLAPVGRVQPGQLPAVLGAHRARISVGSPRSMATNRACIRASTPPLAVLDHRRAQAQTLVIQSRPPLPKGQRWGGAQPRSESAQSINSFLKKQASTIS